MRQWHFWGVVIIETICCVPMDCHSKKNQHKTQPTQKSNKQNNHNLYISIVCSIASDIWLFLTELENTAQKLPPGHCYPSSQSVGSHRDYSTHLQAQKEEACARISTAPHRRTNQKVIPSLPLPHRAPSSLKNAAHANGTFTSNITLKIGFWK